MTLGEKIIKYRKQLGLSQEALSEKVGVSRQGVSKWETDVSIPEIDKLIKLSEVFGITLDYLVKDEESTLDIFTMPNSEKQIAEENSVDAITTRKLTTSGKVIKCLALATLIAGICVGFIEGFMTGAIVFCVNSILVIFLPKSIMSMRLRGDNWFANSPTWITLKRINWVFVVGLISIIGTLSYVSAFFAVINQVQLFNIWVLVYGTELEKLISLLSTNSFLITATALLSLIIVDKVYNKISKNMKNKN